MPFWKKQPVAAGTAVTSPAPSPVQHGFLPCSDAGCPNHDAVQCGYVDRRGQPCLTAWCPTHQVSVDNRCFCRRHSRIPGAVQQGEFLADRGLPDLDNRAPSLVVHVGDALEPRILDLLSSLLRPGSGDTLGSEAVHVNRPPSGGRRWARGWQIYDHTGTIAKVAIEIEESRDAEVTVRVGQHVVATGVPPWIARRKQGLPSLSPEGDGADRERFYGSLFEPIVPRVFAEVAGPLGPRLTPA